jgi:hypothetical protein
MPMAARQELESLASAIREAIFNGSVEDAAAELINHESSQAREGFSSGQPGAIKRYHDVERIRSRMLGFLASCSWFLEDVQTLTGNSPSEGVACE